MHKHSIKDELLLLSQKLPWSKIIYFPAGFQLHLLIIFQLLLKLSDVFLFHSIISFFFFFCCCLCFRILGQGRTKKKKVHFYLTWQKLRVQEHQVILWPSRCPVPLSVESAVCCFQACYCKCNNTLHNNENRISEYVLCELINNTL